LVIVGASLAGLRAAETIRSEGWQGSVILVGDEEHPPYNRPPLSKDLLAGAHGLEQCAFECDLLDVEWRLGTAATALDVERREITLAGGERLPWSRLLIATGARARAWPGPEHELAGLFSIRTLDDALALRGAFADSPRVAIVGAGFIGCETAATARGLGLEVTLLDIASQPMMALGPELAARCAELHRSHGVELRLGVGVTKFEGAEQLGAVRLSDGTSVEADVAVIALGAVPNTEWLRSSGLQLQPGVACDTTLRALGAQDIFCAGDVAAWPHRLTGGDPIRIEHWSVAAQQGVVAGRNLVREDGELQAYDDWPAFWSDQYDVKIQSLGVPARAQRTLIVEQGDDHKLVAVGERDGEVVAVVAFNAPARLAWYRRQLSKSTRLDAVLDAIAARG
jgi:NADPH-dependent 2,4-dienoyl-CoA reductase/sulfur reductase-like enzyme